MSQIEDRFAYNHTNRPEAILVNFRAKSNNFNKWLNKYKGKDAVFILKGKKGFSEPSLYANGNVKLAARLSDF